ncbi:NF-X1 type zinc finger/R3H domain containing protein, putative [Angomonas deanei]|uniref:NF-X1 type zinc finger/R3H domain containing protein, putative n=1 Tax=Angomonas deanei TaxID=59799 RepID=A0A7G2C909_9TRYP|nr:NF-X1 type zinc finger/R3H domain containing protein, putative [Angomonas deanei]
MKRANHKSTNRPRAHQRHVNPDPSALESLMSVPALSKRVEEISVQLTNETYECSICLESVKLKDSTMSCPSCFTTFHYQCVKRWTKTGQNDVGGKSTFSCPQCRQSSTPPNGYVCFCGKVSNPKFDPFLIPHSCGTVCARLKRCGVHRCNLLCHPGPCGECTELITAVPCPCGKTEYSYVCGQGDPKKVCSSICGKALGCGLHHCSSPCHYGECKRCDFTSVVKCVCGKEEREVRCGESFSCSNKCGKTLTCGNHKCQLTCHDGECPLCAFDPAVVATCPCGKVSIKSQRLSCLDPVPTCGNVCNKLLECGAHRCTEKCHEGSCGECKQKVSLPCQCKSTRQHVLCAATKNGVTCDNRCGTKKSCGKHFCTLVCCPEKRVKDSPLHVCHEQCSHTLKCGHRCEEHCHVGPCPPCIHVSTEVLYCACGLFGLPPPQPCGTEPPTCGTPCTKPAACGHEPAPHVCHFGDCPPCLAVVVRPCIGGHGDIEVPCSSSTNTCDAPCGKPLECGHSCPRPCHAGACQGSDKKCQQRCGKPLACGHLCKRLCHEGPCDKCKTDVEVHCKCGFKVRKFPCFKLKDKHESGVEDTDLVPCDRDCLHHSRLNALGEISHPQVDSKNLIYSVFLWDCATKDIKLVKSIEATLQEFLDSGDSFLALPSCKREKRALLHALSNFYGVKSQSDGEEPKRAVSFTRSHNSRAPAVLLSEAVETGKCSPYKLINADPGKAHSVILRGEAVSETTVNALLFEHTGCFVYQPVDLQSALLLFLTEKDANKCCLLLRQRNCPYSLSKLK